MKEITASFIWSLDRLSDLCSHKNPDVRIWAAERIRRLYPVDAGVVMEKCLFDAEVAVVDEALKYFKAYPNRIDSKILIDFYMKNKGVLAGKASHILSKRKEEVLIEAFLRKYPEGDGDDMKGHVHSLVNVGLLKTPFAEHIVQERLKSIKNFASYDDNAVGLMILANLNAGVNLYDLIEFFYENGDKKEFIPQLFLQMMVYCDVWCSIDELIEEDNGLKNRLPVMVEDFLDTIDDYGYKKIRKNLEKLYRKRHFEDILKDSNMVMTDMVAMKERELGKETISRWISLNRHPYPCVVMVDKLLMAKDMLLEKGHLEWAARTAIAILARFVQFLPLVGMIHEELTIEEALEVFLQEREDNEIDEVLLERLSDKKEKAPIVERCLELVLKDPDSMASARAIKLLGEYIDEEIAEELIKIAPSKDELWGEIVDDLKKLGKPFLNTAKRIIKSRDYDRIPYILNVLSDLPFQASTDILIDNWDLLWKEFRNPLLDTVESIGDRRFIALIKDELYEGELRELEAYYTLCVINGVEDPKLKEKKEEVERFRRKTEKILAGIYENRYEEFLLRPLSLRLKCRRCENVYTYNVKKIYIDPEIHEIFISDNIICKKCGALDHYEITKEGELSISAYVQLLTSRYNEEIGEISEMVVVPITIKTLDGRHIPMEEALKAVEKKLKGKPENPLYLLEYANILSKMKRTEDAIPVYEKVIEFDPYAVEAYYELGNVAQVKGNFEKAYYHMKKAFEVKERGSYYKINPEEMEEFKNSIVNNCRFLSMKLGKKEDYFDRQETFNRKGEKKVGRNDPCPCGSGKKYKKCCLLKDSSREASGPEQAKPVIDITYNRLQERLARFIRELPKKAILEASGVYWNVEPKEPIILPDRALDDESKFYEWFLYDYRLKTGKTVIETFLEKHGKTLKEKEVELARSLSRSFMGIYEVQEIEKGKGLRLKDVWTGEEYFVQEVSGTYALTRWDIIMVRVYKSGEEYRLAGFAQLLPRFHMERLFKFLEEEQNLSIDKSIDKRPVFDWHRFMKEKLYIIDKFFDEIQKHPPVVLTEEKDRVIISKAHFYINDFKKVIDAIEDETDFMVEEKKVDFARITWIKRGISKEWEEKESPSENFMMSSIGLVLGKGDSRHTVLGTVEVNKNSLTLECFSKERLDRGKQRLEGFLSGLIRHKVDEFQDLNVGMELAKEKGLPPKGEIKVKGEYKDLIESVFREYYEKWLDERIPALGYMTPKEAVKTEEGKRKVDRLLKDIENAEERKRKMGEPSIDVSFLRKRLGL